MEHGNPVREREDTLLELAVESGAAERKNKPRVFVVLASLVFVGAALYLVVALFSLAGARAGVASESRRTERIAELAREYERARVLYASRVFRSDPLTISQIEDQAELAGLTGVQVTSQDGERRQDAIERKYDLRLTNQDIGNVFKFMEYVRRERDLRGVTLESLYMKPSSRLGNTGRSAWDVEIKYRKWEARDSR